MSQFDIAVAVTANVICFALIAVGGLFYPNTIAGAVARFIFSAS